MKDEKNWSRYYKAIGFLLVFVLAFSGLSVKRAHAAPLIIAIVVIVAAAVATVVTDTLCITDIYGFEACGSSSHSSGSSTPAPTVNISADPSTVEAGQTSMLTWSSSNAAVCTIEPDFGQVDLSGSGATAPLESATTYTFECKGSGGDVSATTDVAATPVANMDVSPGSVDLSSSAPSEAITVTNSGSQESSLNWTASVDGYTEGVSGWLSLSKGAGTVTNAVSGNASEGVTLSANIAMLIKGNYQSTVTLTGTSSPGGKDKHFSSSVTVNLTVGGGCAPANPDCGGYAPVCSNFAASPTHVVVPQTSTLTYSCSHVSSCNITGSDGSSYVASVNQLNVAQGSQVVGPKATTTYALDCMGAGNAIHVSTSLNFGVTVTKPSVQEVPPSP